jgi:hypothetical protein
MPKPEPSSRPSSTTMRWRPIIWLLPFAVLIDAAVAHVGWLIWMNPF